MQSDCSHSASVLPPLPALSFRRGYFTVLELDCLQGTPGGTGVKHTKFLVGFMQSASRHILLDLSSLVLEMNTFVIG